MTSTLSPNGQHYTLDRPLVELAVFDVRYASEIGAPSLETGFALRKELEDAKGITGWSVDDAEMHELVLELGPKGAQAKESSAHGVRLIHAGRNVEIAIFAGAATVQVQRYERWSVSLRPFIEAALAAVQTVIKPVSRNRVGLRYVNTLRDDIATSHQGWAARIERSLIAAIAEGPFATHVVASQHQLQLVLENGMEATLRHGLLQLPSAGSGYLLDWDVYDNASELFSATDVLDCAEKLNREAATLFRASLTQAYTAELGIRDIQEPEETGK
jgi:uncharacterized protein (TIGR04255 family)